ncbi:MAG: FAD-binding oxidoreductase [Halobacteriota archaeon]|nr:FAD-binding oxidoreductase [Halobacteriota archaeon]
MLSEDSVLGILQQIVGVDCATNDLPDLIAYSRDQNWLFVPPQKPDFVVKVNNTRQIREILRLANRYKLPVIPLARGINVRGLCVPTQGGIVVDMREMNRVLEINPEMMTATIQPGVTAGQLSVECMKYGLAPNNTSAPDTVSAAANYLLRGLYFTHSSEGDDHILSMEIVLPSGEIIKTGSAGIKPNAGPYARGGGPNLTGLFQGVPGAFGIVTEMTIKLRPFPKHVWVFFFGFDDIDREIKAIDRVMKLKLPSQLTMAALPDMTKMQNFEDMTALGGLMSERMEKGLRDISPEQMAERMQQFASALPKAFVGGCITDDFTDRFNLYKKTLKKVFLEEGGRDFSSVFKATGGFFFFYEDDMQTGGRADATMLIRGYYHALAYYGPLNRYNEYDQMFKEVAIKHGLDPEGAVLGGITCAPWHGQQTYLERSVLVDPKENPDGLKGYTKECVQNLLDMGIYGWFRPYADTLDATLERWGATGEFLKKIKMLVDPNSIMNPGRFIF